MGDALRLSDAGPLDADALSAIDAYWRAANYCSVGQIYLLDNPLLSEPLRAEHVKPRLLGHFGTTPGLNLVYAHLNRAIKMRDLNMIYVIGPGHGGPGIVANAGRACLDAGFSGDQVEAASSDHVWTDEQHRMTRFGHPGLRHGSTMRSVRNERRCQPPDQHAPGHSTVGLDPVDFEGDQ